MVLNHVADGSSLVIKTAATLYSEVFRHRELDALDVIAAPKGFHKSIGEAERQHIVHSALSKIVVDAEDVAFIEGPEQNLIQFLRRGQIVPEGLFHNHPG